MNSTETSAFAPAVSHSETPLTADYEQFVPAPVPLDGKTTKAWLGTIQPFLSDADAVFALSEIEQDRNLWISAGTIRGGKTTQTHWANPLLVRMDERCEVLICEQQAAMPRAYLLSPRFLEHYALSGVHPHPRGDQLINYRGSRIPGMCVFSSAEQKFSDEHNFYTQFLDLVSQYVAKHLIWLRTRRLNRVIGQELTVLHQPLPGAHIVDAPPKPVSVTTPFGKLQAVDYWSGYWPGQHARAMTPLEHVQQIRPDQRCWCGIEDTYGNCHRPKDIEKLPTTLRLRYSTRK